MINESQRDAALITFLATASGMHFLGLSSSILGHLYWLDCTLGINQTRQLAAPLSLKVPKVNGQAIVWTHYD